MINSEVRYTPIIATNKHSSEVQKGTHWSQFVNFLSSLEAVSTPSDGLYSGDRVYSFSDRVNTSLYSSFCLTPAYDVCFGSTCVSLSLTFVTGHNLAVVSSRITQPDITSLYLAGCDKSGICSVKSSSDK